MAGTNNIENAQANEVVDAVNDLFEVRVIDANRLDSSSFIVMLFFLSGSKIFCNQHFQSLNNIIVIKWVVIFVALCMINYDA